MVRKGILVIFVKEELRYFPTHFFMNPLITVYAIYFAYRYFRDFGLGGQISIFLFYNWPCIEVETFARTDLRNS